MIEGELDETLRGAARSLHDAIREVLGTAAIGFSILTAGLAGILMEVARSRALLERLCDPPPNKPGSNIAASHISLQHFPPNLNRGE
jgi:hypothetical protein